MSDDVVSEGETSESSTAVVGGYVDGVEISGDVNGGGERNSELVVDGREEIDGGDAAEETTMVARTRRRWLQVIIGKSNRRRSRYGENLWNLSSSLGSN
ncbi:unnamed protein product [Arabis nemorensis]|uniref:Uncharacterized protein n=1 Tax=Arabis nemorensis TaxID=586526 RepID=A0A565AUK7_9BRAS|nr:unnamed protein product [Arabis nemorensis]